MARFTPRRSARLFAAIAVCGASVTGVAAATVHRLAITQATGSGGATAYVQSASSGGALQGEVASSANTTIKIPFGVLGEYDAAGQVFGVGVIGVSATGYAVAGESLSNTQPSVLAYPGGNGIGLEAVSTSTSSSPAIVAEAKGSGDGGDFMALGTGLGISATSKSSTAAIIQGAGDVYAAEILGGLDGGQSGPPSTTGGLEVLTGCFSPGTNTPGATAIEALSCTGDGMDVYALYGHEAVAARTLNAPQAAYLSLNSGEGVVADGSSSNAAHPALLAAAGNATTDPFATFSTSGSTSQKSFVVQGATANRSGQATYTGGSDVQVSGDLYIVGQVFQGCKAFPAVGATTCSPVPIGSGSGASITHAAGGSDVRTFAGRQSVPTVEDFGEGQLQNGRAYVRLDPAFARTISTTSTYLLFITPEGQSHGLYAANRTLSGFEVCENDGGHSSLAFDYRIVAKPLGDVSARFAAVTAKAPIAATPDRTVAARFHAPANVSVGKAPKPQRFVPPALRDPRTGALLPAR